MSEDIIRREDAIEVIKKMMEVYWDRKVVLARAWEQIKDLPSANLQPTCNKLATSCNQLATDYISRQAAIEALRRAEALTKAFGYHNVIEIIRDLPSADIDLSDYSDRLWRKAYEQGKADAESRWIPVTERLPEDGERVLLQIAEVCLYGDSYVEDYYYVSGSRSKGRWFINVHPDMSVERGGIIAWMPLPNTWKGESDD